MKYLFNIFTLLFLTNYSIGQISIDTIYLDSKWEKSGKDNYDYYRVLIKQRNDWYDCKDFWKSGEIQMEGKLSSLYPQTREDEFKWYHKNGNLRQIIKYKNNNIIGQVQIYDSNGNFEFEYVLLSDSLDNAAKMKISLSDFRNHISQKLKYPKNSRMAEIEGKVIAKFYIDNSGSVSRLTILKSVNEELDNEAKRVIESYRNWPVPRYKGKNSNFEIVIPINFILD